jgi:hypothetical protein
MSSDVFRNNFQVELYMLILIVDYSIYLMNKSVHNGCDSTTVVFSCPRHLTHDFPPESLSYELSSCIIKGA